MIGLGTVGTGVVRLLSQQRRLALKKIAVRDAARSRSVSPPCPVTTDVSEVLDDPEIEVVIEVMGGENPALGYIQRAIARRKHVVTANKEVLARHGPEIFQQARQRGVAVFFEASVAGGIPLISTIQKGLEANRISSVTGILNGTTNFILSRMEEEGADFAAALAEAQALGLAEADPASDVDGHDVAYKLSILSALAFGRFVRPQDITREGIRAVAAEDIAQVRELGYRVKLVGSTRRDMNGGEVDVRVHPMLVPASHPLAAVKGSSNGILVTGDAVGEIAMVGPGAGQMPTASAVVGDTINLASALQLPDFASYFQPAIEPEWARAAPPGDWRCPFYLRLSVADAPGVIGGIGTIFGARDISIRVLLQRGARSGEATIIILTHQARAMDMQTALAELRERDFLRETCSCIPVFHPAAGNRLARSVSDE